MLSSQPTKIYRLAKEHIVRTRSLSRSGVSSPLRIHPELYARKNCLQAVYNRKLLDVFQPAFRVPQDTTQQYLDVGCGTGDFTRDGLLPRCQPCHKLVGVDCSPEMIDYARSHSAHPSISFHELNLEGDVEPFISEFGQFDRVYSFFCLHWLADQAKGLKNIARLLKRRGECLIGSCAAHQGSTVWKQLAKMDRWTKYSELLKKFIPQTEGMSDREMIETMSRWLAGAGLVPSTLEISRAELSDSGTLEDKTGMHLAVVPIINFVTEEEKPQLVADVTQLAERVHALNADQSSYKTIIIKACKIAND